jgi:hypothetical protein
MSWQAAFKGRLNGVVWPPRGRTLASKHAQCCGVMSRKSSSVARLTAGKSVYRASGFSFGHIR